MANEGPLAGTDLFANNSNRTSPSPSSGRRRSQNFGFQTSLNPLYVIRCGTTGPGGAPASTTGQPSNFTATETNTSDLPVTILNAGDAFDIVLGYDDDLLIPASDVSPVGQVVTLQPGQSQTFTATWDPGSDPNLPRPAPRPTRSSLTTIPSRVGEPYLGSVRHAGFARR